MTKKGSKCFPLLYKIQLSHIINKMKGWNKTGKTKAIILILFNLTQTLTIFCQSIETKPELNTDDIFLSVTFLQESQNFYNEDAGFDYAYRFILTTSEIYDQIYLEKVSYGEEGGYKRLEWRKKLNMDILYKLGAKGEISNVKLIDFPGKDTLKISIQESEYEISNLDSEKWIIRKN